MPLLLDRNRRHFLKATAAAAGLTFDTRPLVAQWEAGRLSQLQPASWALPTGHIGKLEVTRLICGGNLFSGFAHSGELLYVHSLLQHYFTDDKILDTLQLCEESGINTTILRTDEQILRILKRYRQERGGKIQWIAQTYPAPDNLKDNIKLAIDNGAVGAYCMGGVADDTFVKAGKAELIGEVVSFIQQNGLVAGVGSHTMETAIISEQQKFNPDFYFKTFNSVGYNTQDARDVAALMKTIKKPWIAFKVLGAGRVLPKDGFDLAFKNGADFINVGMYDFQVSANTSLAREIVERHGQRERAWA
jgi:hypothetical protein